MASKLNFNYSIGPPRTCCKWGGPSEENPENFTGLVGDLQNWWTDVGWANLFITPARAKYIDYTSSYRNDPGCLVVNCVEIMYCKRAKTLYEYGFKYRQRSRELFNSKREYQKPCLNLTLIILLSNCVTQDLGNVVPFFGIPELGDRRVSEFLFCSFWKKLESVRVGKNQNRKVSASEIVRIGKCQHRKVSASESIRIGKCPSLQFWPFPSLQKNTPEA